MEWEKIRTHSVFIKNKQNKNPTHQGWMTQQENRQKTFYKRGSPRGHWAQEETPDFMTIGGRYKTAARPQHDPQASDKHRARDPTSPAAASNG